MISNLRNNKLGNVTVRWQFWHIVSLCSDRHYNFNCYQGKNERKSLLLNYLVNRYEQNLLNLSI